MSIDWKKFKRMFLRGLAICGGGSFLIMLILYFLVSGDVPPMSDIENPQMDLSTQIYTADGQLIGSMHRGQNRIYVKLDDISKYAKDALLATEDVRFYDHSGIDPGTIPSMFYRNLLKGQKSGGSGIPQQLARNLYDQVGKENSIMRKLKEAYVAILLESRFTKDEIMQAYLNTSSFYGNTYGIELASRRLFSKNSKDLELHEAALLIGLLKSPTLYSPTRNAERAVNRRNTVIDQMEKYNFIDEEQAETARNEPLGLRLRGGDVAGARAEYFRDHAIAFLKEWNKATGERYDLHSDGLKVYTTIDSRIQKHAERAVKEHLTELQKDLEKEFARIGTPWSKDRNMVERAMQQTHRWWSAKQRGLSKGQIIKEFREPVKMRIWTWEGEMDTTMAPRDSVIHYLKYLETGFMAMDPKGGEIRAWVGGNDYGFFQYDHVYKGRRQVGSTFKPIVYAAAMGNGRHEPCEAVLDIPVSIELPDGKLWTPANSGGKGDGLVTYATGLARSKNQVTAYLMKEIGPDAVCELAKRLGISSDLDCVPSLCLGTTDISVHDMVGAYGAFANYGVYSKPYFITRIEDRHGNVIASFIPEQKQAMDTTTAFMILSMLRGVVDQPRGTGHRLRAKYKFEGEIAGKTGTTQDNTDGWFMGITPDLVAGGWVGGADRKVRFKSTRYGQGANMALPIWATFFRYVYADKEIGIKPGAFRRPDNYRISMDCRDVKPVTDYSDDNLPENLPF